MISSILNKKGSISLNILEKDLVTIKNEGFLKFKKQLEIITTINKGDKLSKLEEYYIDVGGLGQKWKRWWWNQNRSKTFKDLSNDFIKFADFLDDILEKMKSPNKKYIKLVNNIVVFVNELMIGLYNLKTTYPDYKEIQCKIDSIILTLIDFKENVIVKKAETPLYAGLTYRRNSFDI
jgi:hypothetical protein